MAIDFVRDLAVIATRTFSATFTFKVFRKLSIWAILTSNIKFIFAWIAPSTGKKERKKTKEKKIRFWKSKKYIKLLKNKTLRKQKDSPHC